MRYRFAANTFILTLVLACAGAVLAQDKLAGDAVPLGEIKAGADGKTPLEQWREDLAFVKTELPARHKNLFHRLDRDKFYREIDELDAKLPGMTENRAALEIERIVGLARDGHTWTSPLAAPALNFRMFPLGMYVFGDELYVRRADPAHAEIVGGKVLRIGRMTAAEAFQKVAPYMSVDNEMGARERVPRYLASPEVLEALGISDTPGRVTLVVEKDGRKLTREISLPPGRDNSVRAVRHGAGDWIDARDGAKNPTPLTLKHPDKRFWYEYVPDRKVLYVQLNAVLNDDERTLKDFFGEVFEAVRRHDPDKFVLDLRHNGGGNNTLIRPIIRGLIRHEKIDRPGHLFVIIGRGTFSAAQNLTNELENWTEAVFIGEPTASHVNMYGDARRFELPNSKMPIWISELWWQNKHARDERRWTAPDVAAEPDFESYAANVDPAMEAVYSYKPRRSLEEVGMEAYRKRDFELLRKVIADFRDEPANKYFNVEREVNLFGYSLLRADRVDDAIKVFRINVELFPEAFNTYDSLAEAYMVKGEMELAVKFYKRSLELNPDNINAVRMLEKIRQGN